MAEDFKVGDRVCVSGSFDGLNGHIGTVTQDFGISASYVVYDTPALIHGIEADSGMHSSGELRPVEHPECQPAHMLIG